MQATFERVPHPADASFLVKRRNDRKFEFWWHFHPEMELNFIERSQGRRLVGDAIEDYDDGDLVLLGSGLPHTWYSEERGGKQKHQSVVVQFLPEFLGREFFSRSELTGITRLFQAAHRGLQFTGSVQESVGRQMRELPRLDGLRRLLSLLAILDELAQAKARPLASAGYVPGLDESCVHRVNDVLAFIAGHYTEPITQRQAAQVAHLSPSAFSRFFHRAIGKTFKRHVNELRVGKACRMLIESDRAITEIALASGFANLANFNRRFLEQKGVSPRAFRLHWKDRGTPRVQ